MKTRVSAIGFWASRLIGHLRQPPPNSGIDQVAAARLPIPAVSRQTIDGRPIQDDSLVVFQGLKSPHYLNPCNSMEYLLSRQNRPHDIEKMRTVLQMPHVLLEIGCGDGEAARQIAQNNPDIGIIATDLFDWSTQQHADSHYRKIALQWRSGRLQAQSDSLANIVVLRAEADLLGHLPCRSIDTVFLLNPEPRVGRSFLHLFKNEALSTRMKNGPLQILILPYSRELGVAACGGCSFEHDPDWSKGLGFLMESGLCFKLGTSVHWGLDLSALSAYSGNSTQRGIYVFGQQSI